MKLFLVLLLTATVSLAQESQILVTPQWLNDHLKDPDLVVLQSNFLQFEYDKEHIAGARFLWPGGLAPNSPKGNYNAPDIKDAENILQSLGISQNSRIVICHVTNEVSPSARMFLTMENLGLRGQVKFLNGGLEAWKRAGFPVTKEVPVVKRGNFKAKPGNLIVDKEYVLKTLNSNSGVVVDARAKNFYDGDPTGNPRDGHITGAKNIYFSDMADSLNVFKPSGKLQEYFTPVVPDKKSEIVTYCFIGQTASVLYMAGRILGYDMKLYDGSMQEWSRIESLPMEKTVK